MLYIILSNISCYCLLVEQGDFGRIVTDRVGLVVHPLIMLGTNSAFSLLLFCTLLHDTLCCLCNERKKNFILLLLPHYRNHEENDLV